MALNFIRRDRGPVRIGQSVRIVGPGDEIEPAHASAAALEAVRSALGASGEELVLAEGDR